MTRIKLHFFHGLRACSYCFIKSDFSKINDLMKHIGKLFHIDSFSLILNNFVLPAAEDIQVVQNDDIILVMPNIIPAVLPPLIDNNIMKGQESEEINGIQASKKRRLHSCDFNEPVATSSAKRVANVGTKVQYYNNLSNHVNEATTNLNDSHKQNRPQDGFEYEAMDTVQVEQKHQEDANCQKHESQSTSMNDTSNNEKEMKKQLLTSSESNEYSTPTTHLKSVNTNTSKQKIPQHVTPVVNSLSNTDAKKKINIVHDILFNNNPVSKSNSGKPVEMYNRQLESTENSSPVKESKCVEEVCSVLKSTINAASNQVKATSEKMMKSFKADRNIAKDVKINGTLKKQSKCAEKQLENSVGNLLSNLRSHSHDRTPLASCSYSLGDQTENIAICDSSRVRHRSKRKMHLDTPIPASKIVYHKSSVETKPLIHRFFEDDDEEIEFVTVNKPNKYIETTFQKDDSANSSIISVNDTLIECDENGQGIANTEQPLTEEKMNKLFPSPGDVIVFQILKLRLNCTPGVSKDILARVLSFDVTTQQTELLILDGLSEFQNSQDFVSGDGERVTNKKIMDWKLLLNPRLLSATL